MTSSHTPEQVAEIARGLTDAQRRAWFKIVLAVVATEPQRRAFVSGYNGAPVPPPNSSAKMLEMYRDGLKARAFLKDHQK